MLSLSINGTRRAPWWMKLGIQSSMAFPISLSSIRSGNSGTIPLVSVVVTRQYPVLYMETISGDGAKVTRDERGEQIAAKQHAVRDIIIGFDIQLH